jgi:hypothetical protein
MTLRVHRSVEQEVVVLTLTGRIQAEQVQVLKDCLDLESSNVVLDLAYVKLVDREAVRFLAECESSGMKLRNCAGYIREWIAQEKSAGLRTTEKSERATSEG